MLQFKSQLPADSPEVSLNFSRASESCLNVRQNILTSNVFQKIGTRDKPRRLLSRATE
jgi:hypothetical protein